MAYFPDEIKKPGTLFSDRIFTWTILFAIRPEWAQAYYDEVIEWHNRRPIKVAKSEIVVSEKWLAELAKFDFLSKKANSKRASMNVLVARNPST